MLRIWGRSNSVNVQKALWCCEEMSLPYERVDAGGSYGVVNTQQYRNLNPNGLVPTIEEDGFVLYESNAIVRYLARADSALFPAEPRRRADIDRWMEWQSTGFTPAQTVAFWNLIRTPEPQRDMAAVEASRAKSEKHAAVLDKHLAGRRYITGDEFTAADIVVGCATHRWLNLPLRREPRPHLERWYAEIKARPASRQVTSQVPLT